MKFLISIIYLTLLFSCVYGQSEAETPKESSLLKSDSKPETEKEFSLDPKKLEKERLADNKQKSEENQEKSEKEEEKPEKKKRTEIQVNTNYEALTKGLGTWRSMTINVRHDFSQRKVLYGFYQKVMRSSAEGDTVTVGYYQPLTKKFRGLFEMSASPSHRFLPTWSGLFQLETKISSTAFLNTGYRHTIYKQSKVSVFNVGLEQYWKSYRFTYSAYMATSKGVGNSYASRVQIDKYYGNNLSTLSADISFGHEIESVFTENQILKANITNFSLGGKHWLNKKFGVNYRASFHRQGSFYSRGGTSLGIIFRF